MIRAKANVFPIRHEVWIVNLDPVVGREQGGIRPALIVSEDKFNRSPAGLVMIAPITGTDRRIRAHVRIDPPEGGLVKTSFIMTDQLRAISKMRLDRRLSSVSSAKMTEVEGHMRIHLGL